MKKIPLELRQAALEELSNFKASVNKLAESSNLPAKLLFDFLGVAASVGNEKRGKFTTWMEYQRQNFASASAEARRRLTPVDSNSLAELSDSNNDKISKATVLSSCIGVLSEWYKKITPEEEAQLALDAAKERELREKDGLTLKRKRGLPFDIPAEPKRLKVEASRVADSHLQQIVSHLNLLQTSFGVQSLVIVSGGGYRTMAAGSLMNSTLPYAKIFAESIMPLKEFQKRIEGVVKIGEGIEENGLASKMGIQSDQPTIAKLKSVKDARIKELGDKLRELYGAAAGAHPSDLLQWDFGTLERNSHLIHFLRGNPSFLPVKIDGWPTNVRMIKPKSLRKDEQVRLLDALDKGLISMEALEDIKVEPRHCDGSGGKSSEENLAAERDVILDESGEGEILARSDIKEKVTRKTEPGREEGGEKEGKELKENEGQKNEETAKKRNGEEKNKGIEGKARIESNGVLKEIKNGKIARAGVGPLSRAASALF